MQPNATTTHESAQPRNNVLVLICSPVKLHKMVARVLGAASARRIFAAHLRRSRRGRHLENGKKMRNRRRSPTEIGRVKLDRCGVRRDSGPDPDARPSRAVPSWAIGAVPAGPVGPASA